MFFRKYSDQSCIREWVFVAILILITICSGCKKQLSSPLVNQYPLGEGSLVIPPAGSAYTGSYLAFGDTEDQLSLEKIEQFEKNVGKHQAIIAFSSFWGEQTFPSHNLDIISRHGSMPLIYWSPWDRPYEQDKGPDRFNLHAILSGQWDAYIDMWATSAKKFGHPLFVSWGLEMNGTWFPWSGCFYGAPKTPVHTGGPQSPNVQKAIGPEIYKSAYRYVVNRVRKCGAKNILWVFHVNSYSYPLDNWNMIAQYYPGPNYVDWLGLSAYGIQFKDESWVTVKDTFYYPYLAVCALDPHKPIMMAEWGIADFPKFGDKAAWLTEAFGMLSSQFPRLKAAIVWNERWQNDDKSFSNLRVTSSLESLEAYRAGVASPFWLGNPILKK